MKHRPGREASDRGLTPEIILRCVGNLIVIGALPYRLGQMGAPLWCLPVYAVLAGLMMTLAEDLRAARTIFERRDVRSYAQVRVALVAALGTAPFAAGLGIHL